MTTPKETFYVYGSPENRAFGARNHSRLGRNRLKVGALMKQFQEDYDVRYIAVSDGIDFLKDLDDMVAVRETFNEFYPRDTSKKVHTVFRSRGESGQRICTQVSYGYLGDKYHWEVDPEAAAVVRKIFALCIALQIQHGRLLRALYPGYCVV